MPSTPTRAAMALLDLLAEHDIDAADALIDEDVAAFLDHARRASLERYVVDVDVVRSYAIAVDLPPGSPSYKIIEAVRDSGRAGWLVESTIDMSVR
jgi:hypothetical protein